MSASYPSSLPLHNASIPPRRTPSPASSSLKRSTAQSSSITSTYSKLSPQETANRLNTDLVHGLTPSDAEARLLRDGPNELPHEEPEPLWLRFLKQFKEPLILLLLASAAISFFMRNFDDAVSITLAVTIVVTVGFVQEYRSEKSLEALNRLVPHYAHLVRNLPSGSTGRTTPGAASTKDQYEMQDLTDSSSSSGSEAAKGSTTVVANRLVPGDLVLFSTGDRIPADLRITRATHLTIDESNLTGENEPVTKFSAALCSPTKASLPVHAPAPPRSPFYDSPAAGTVGTDLRLSEQHNIAFMGTLVRSGHGQGIVIATGPHTEFGSISASLQEIESPRTPLQLSMDRLGQELSYVSFVVIGLIVIIGLIQGRKILEMFTIGVSLAVAAIPEGLPIIVTVTLALGVLRMANRGAIVRRLPSVETLGSVNVVCSDKTGTLTLNHMTVTKMWHFDAESPPSFACTCQLSCNGGISRYFVVDCRPVRGSDEKAAGWGNQPDVALLDLLDTLGEDDLRLRINMRLSETPFSSERKWMGVVVGRSTTLDDVAGNGDGNEVAYIKGSLEEVLKRCDTYLTKDGQEIILDERRRRDARQAAESMAQEGLRVIAFASGPVKPTRGPRSHNPRSHHPTHDHSQLHGEECYTGLVFAGMVGMNDPPRKDVHRSIRRLLTGGVRVIMITGDAETTAVAIAKKLGMPINMSANGRSFLRGDEIDHMTTEELAQAITGTSIFARTSPDHKMKIVKALQYRGDVVAMTGDGVNDAPALKKADIGISMGLLGTDVAKEAADMILTDDDFSTILRAIEQGKGIFYNIQNFITFQLSTSVAALSLVLISTGLGFKNPLNAMQILWIITRRDTTMTFTCFVLFDMFNALTCRSEGKSLLRGELALTGNKMFNYAVLGSLLGQASVFWVDELRKYLMTRGRRGGLSGFASLPQLSGVGYSVNILDIEYVDLCLSNNIAAFNAV
ncbi:calcium-transporting ATPase 1 (Golgi Ca(2)-ATPase) [Coccidioides immitis RMSCC 3703]|uniref:Calcium-transporting ATPase 1 (Golgi Ca(2)-ATPase) n=1 Tax=Coccidioides immitis RMSCC 3703 TaxID=454286 RepID=A0A0J8QK94_COCIT|nr:calcium-transporting ATPase 1 (Golgi Ca(2)-ATPase) [Coccidioides immitis RMSCC 3703]